MTMFCVIFRRALVAAASLVIASAALADHGPGTSGGGMSVQSAELLKPGQKSLEFRLDFTSYESLSADAIQDKTLLIPDEHAHFDALRWSLLETVSFWYGVSERFQAGASTGWYRGDDLREGHVHHDGGYGYHDLGDVSGMTDIWVQGKYRLHKGPNGSWAAFGGIKLPTGRDDVRGMGEDEPLEPSLQPGSGAFDLMAGAAYTNWLTPHLTLDASGQYVHRTENDHYKVGDRGELGAALAWRFTENTKTYPQPSAFLEASWRWLGRNREDGEWVGNSGGATLFLSPGFRTAWNERFAWSAMLQFPVWQDPRGEQQKTDFKAVTAMSLTF